MNKYNELIKKLKLIPHPEGGYFVETLRDKNQHFSHIYYLLKYGEISQWHKLNKNEVLFFYDGDPLQVSLSKDKKYINKITIGKYYQYHFVVEAETWFSMISLGRWSLIGCIVAPAFNYSDLELAPPNWSPGLKNI